MTSISGRSGAWVDGIAATCSDGTKSAYYGGGGGLPWEETDAGGFRGAALSKNALYTSSLQFKDAAGTPRTLRGKAEGTVTDFTCPAGMSLYGMSGASDRHLDRVRFACRAPPTSTTGSGTGTGTGTGTESGTGTDTGAATLTGDAVVAEEEGAGQSNLTLYIIIIVIIVAIVAAMVAVMYMIRRAKTRRTEPSTQGTR